MLKVTHTKTQFWCWVKHKPQSFGYSLRNDIMKLVGVSGGFFVRTRLVEFGCCRLLLFCDPYETQGQHTDTHIYCHQFQKNISVFSVATTGWPQQRIKTLYKTKNTEKTETFAKSPLLYITIFRSPRTTLTSVLIFEMTHSSPWRPLPAFELIRFVNRSSM